MLGNLGFDWLKRLRALLSPKHSRVQRRGILHLLAVVPESCVAGVLRLLFADPCASCLPPAILQSSLPCIHGGSGAVHGACAGDAVAHRQIPQVTTPISLRVWHELSETDLRKDLSSREKIQRALFDGAFNTEVSYRDQMEDLREKAKAEVISVLEKRHKRQSPEVAFPPLACAMSGPDSLGRIRKAIPGPDIGFRASTPTEGSTTGQEETPSHLVELFTL